MTKGIKPEPDQSFGYFCQFAGSMEGWQQVELHNEFATRKSKLST
jgi:hypothetical protein